MTTPSFDPYRDWLGISPSDRPPSAYRLLGLTLFESSPAAINNAAGRLLLFLNAVRNNEPAYSRDAIKIMAEVADARLILLNHFDRARYDAILRRQQQIDRQAETLARNNARPKHVAPPPPPSLDMGVDRFGDAGDYPGQSAYPSPQVMLLAGFSGCFMLMVALLLFCGAYPECATAFYRGFYSGIGGTTANSSGHATLQVARP